MTEPAMNPSPDAAPAHALWVELATRVTTQPLYGRSGEEETAIRSMAGLFPKVRKLLKQYPDAAGFRSVALTLLNDVLRAPLARWRGWLAEDAEQQQASGRATLRFRDELARNQFRSEIAELQPTLAIIRDRLAELAGIATDGAGTTPPRPPAPDLGGQLRAGIQAGQVSARRNDEVDKEPSEGLVGWETINRKEQATVLRRREILGTRQGNDVLPSPERLRCALDHQGETPTHCAATKLHDAAGLALSGGGIRSATFALGAVQVLARHKLLLPFDYLSTVSGGGYLGSFLSCALGTCSSGEKEVASLGEAESKVTETLRRRDKESRSQGIESRLVRHLRNHSRYLLNGGFVGELHIAALAVAGILWNALILLPIPLLAAAFVSWASGWFWGSAIPGGLPKWPSPTGSVVGWLLTILAFALAILLLSLPAVQLLTHGRPPRSKPALLCRIWEDLTLGVAVGAVVAGGLYLVPALFHVSQWFAKKTTREPWSPGLSLAALTTLLGTATTVLAAVGTWLSPRWPRVRSLVVKSLVWVVGPLLLLFVFLLAGSLMGLPGGIAGGSRFAIAWVKLLAMSLLFWELLCVNINTLSPHRYYRNRLCECYLARRIRERESNSRRRSLARERIQGSVEVLQQVKLSDLGKDATAPYHLINMALNVPASKDDNLRGRKCDFFLASRSFCGSPLTGYVETEQLEEADGHFDLGTAMAVSGAAASTNMGWKTLPHFRFLMALLNIRLGYWLRRPGRSSRHSLLDGVGPLYLFREMRGSMDEDCSYVNLSDGGHIENLAVYELLRRRCKFIVCVDGGCDPGMECSDLMRVQRYAEIDLGIRMRFDIADLQRESNGLSHAHAILVRIDYPPDEDRGNGAVGWMVYLKLAMTGAEPNHVKDYRRENPAFPHQSTGDQLFDEAQFESYRALGECAMESLFREEIPLETAPSRLMRTWFENVASNLLPDHEEVFLPPASRA